MDPQELLSLISRWLHILSAIALAGGTIFIRFALVPASQSDNRGDPSSESTVYRCWSRIVMVSIGFLLISGIYNAAIKAVEYDLGPMYHSLLGIKILVAIAVFALASLLAGRSALARKLRARERAWLNLNLFLMVVVVMIAGYLKQMDAPLRGQHEPTAQAAPAITETLAETD